MSKQAKHIIRMKNHTEYEPDTQLSSDNTHPDEWSRYKTLTLRNTHRIEQLEAKEQDDREDRSQLQKLLQTYMQVHGDTWSKNQGNSNIGTLASDVLTVPLLIRETFKKLKDDFKDYANRIAWCNELEVHLENFEEELDDYDAKYLSWFVSTLKDVLSYNYAENLSEKQLFLLEKGINVIYEKQEYCDKDLFAEYHLELVESGLSLLPTSQKAIDELGE